MNRKTLSEIAAAVGGTVRGARGSEVVVSSLVVDSRTASPGAMFVALPGERADGHLFVADALGGGAVAALVRRGWGGPEPVVEVDDPAASLLELARTERDGLRATVIGITGST